MPTTKPKQIDNQGPARSARALTARQTKFVVSYIENGGRTEAAALAAGYAPDGAGNQGRQLLRNPKVYTEVMKRVPDLIGINAVPAVAVVVRLMQSAKSDYVKLEAARDLLDRAGFQPAQRVDHRLDSTLSVSLNLGGSKSGGTGPVTHPDTRNFPQKDFSPHPHTGKSPLELDLVPTSPEKGGIPYGIEGAPVEISPPIVKNTTWADDASGD